MTANLAFAYFVAGLVVQLVIQLVVARRGGHQPTSKGFRPAPGQIRWGGISLAVLLLWPVELIRWPRAIDRFMALSEAAPAPSPPPRVYTEQEYEAAERRSDRLVMLWFVVIAGAAGLSGLLSATTGWDVGWCTVLVMGASVGGFYWRASRGAADLPAPRPRPIRPLWIAKMMAFLFGLCIVALVLAGIVSALD